MALSRNYNALHIVHVKHLQVSQRGQGWPKWETEHRYKFLPDDPINQESPIHDRGGPVVNVWINKGVERGPASGPRELKGEVLPEGRWDVMLCDPRSCSDPGCDDQKPPGDSLYKGLPFVHSDDVYDTYTPAGSFQYIPKTWEGLVDADWTDSTQKMVAFLQANTILYVNASVCVPSTCSVCSHDRAHPPPPPADSGDDEMTDIDEDEDPNAEWLIRRIVDSRNLSSKAEFEYLVEWAPFDGVNYNNSWEAWSSLGGTQDAIDTFHENNPGKPHPSSLQARRQSHLSDYV